MKKVGGHLHDSERLLCLDENYTHRRVNETHEACEIGS